jgi:hypothetical protein
MIGTWTSIVERQQQQKKKRRRGGRNQEERRYNNYTAFDIIDITFIRYVLLDHY